MSSKLLMPAIMMPHSHRPRRHALPAVLLLIGTLAGALSAATSEKVAFNRDVRPILSDQCFACHGFDARKRKGNLRLDTAEGAFTPNKDGRVAIKPGHPESSELWRRVITADADDVMPPTSSHKALSATQKELIKRWIEQGAPYQRHWAFEPPTPSGPPIVRQERWIHNPVDRFVLARLERENLKPSPEASRPALIRRVAFDLTGLPPSREDVERFVRDRSKDAYEKMVDRYLASPRYGEHMAKHWLDVARYADTHGLHLDNERQMWAYRDWVVRAFNTNMPFSDFTVAQLAGDLLPQPTLDQQIATGFIRNNVTTGEGGAIDEEFIFRYTVDRAATTLQTWMGLTAGCAVCHDHKFDPLPMKDFYSVYAFFHSAADPAMDGNALRTPPSLQLKTAEDDQRLAAFDTQIQAEEKRLRDGLERLVYTDPASLQPPPAPREEEVIWLDDEVPTGLRGGSSPTFSTTEKGPVFSGQRALRRQDSALSQDVFESDTPTLTLPAQPRLFAYVYLDPAHPPRMIMLQYNREGWEHRAVWGDADATEWGEKGKPSRLVMGPLPKAGEWVRLECSAEQVGLQAGDSLKGIAFTQHGGLVYWDKAGVAGRVDPAHDPNHSWAVWLTQNEGKEVKDLPEDLRKALKETPAAQRSPEQTSRLRDHYLSRICADTRGTFEPMRIAMAEVRKKRNEYSDAIPTTFVFRDMEKPRDTFVMVRGQYDKRGDRVTRGVPSAFPPLKNTQNPNRLDLARWLLEPENPLTARVTVNRFWQQFFGIGLVRTSDDFGSQGEPPSHPELLDWLALHFRETGWDVKALVRMLVTSSTYRQSSEADGSLWQRDPANRLLARGARFRLDAEQLRDNALAVSGLLDLTMGGRGVRPYQPPNIWEPVGYVGSNTREYKQDTGSALYRRSLYVFFKRTAPPPFLSTFDAPNREMFCTRRERSNTPLQALQLLNDVQHFEAARALAQRMMQEGGRAARQRLSYGWEVVLGRKPAAAELRIVQDAFDKHLARYQADPEAAKKAVHFGESAPCAQLPEAELAAYTLAANLLLNLDETVTRN